MNVFVLNREFEIIDIIDDYSSLIWTERYCEYGDFELIVQPSLEYISYAESSFYLSLADTDRVMIIESYDLSSDEETGSALRLTGRSLESILDRRIIWKTTRINGNLQNGVERLIREAIIDATIPERRIPNFIFEASKDASITKLKFRKQFTGNNLYESIQLICSTYGLGFKVVLNNSNQMVFSLYNGADLQEDVIFSPEYDNLLSSEYVASTAEYRNVALIAGEDQNQNRRTSVVNLDSASGLDRRELYVDARDIQSEEEDGTLISNDEYTELLNTRGREKLVEYKTDGVLEANANLNRSFFYGIDYFIGDIVSIRNEFDMGLIVRASEIVRAYTPEEGYTALPSFSIYEPPYTINEEDIDEETKAKASAESADADGYTRSEIATNAPTHRSTDLAKTWTVQYDTDIRNSASIKGNSLIAVKKGAKVTSKGRYSVSANIIWYYVTYLHEDKENNEKVSYTGFIDSSKLFAGSASNANYKINTSLPPGTGSVNQSLLIPE